MVESNVNIFKSKLIIDDNEYRNIYALSDIHSDIFPFIVSLRDCAKVIRKKNSLFN